MTAPKQDSKLDPNSFYDDNDPVLSDDAIAILTQYSGVPQADLIPHVRAIRDAAFKLFPYPCIGQYNFMSLSIAKDPQYPSILSRVQRGETLLDLACCFGQDLRKLVFDGAPSTNLTGFELEQGFLDGGYDLFDDRDTFDARMIAGDFFSPSAVELGLEEGGYDMLHAASFYHLFSRAEQVEALTKSLRLLKPQPGSMVFGRQSGVEKPGVLKHPATRSGEMYRHDVESWQTLMEEVVAGAGVRAVCECEGYESGNTQMAGVYGLMRFCLRLM
ncbi:hypothetical protein LTR53_012151 [Teratosphaeriaceae sp. CCFEE 6253]|nr:hypothetical protein LTR53_012151 [Teratosphaeriaceae sp. CCFEE 6253]